MSRVFDALRKSETEAGRRVSSSPNSFFASLASADEPFQVATERVEIRPESRIVAHSAPHSLGGERFRMLKSYLKELQAGGALKTLLITSASPQDGKSTVATNLATALSDGGKYKVLLIEADLRRPALKALLGLTIWPGLTEYLQDGIDPMAAIRRIEPLAIYLLPAGSQAANPLELLQSERFAQLMTSLATHFDWIVMDAPPAVPIADTLALTKAADSILLVVRAGQTAGHAVDEAMKQLVGHSVLGIILNCAEKLDGLYGEYYWRGANQHPA
jgi:capsular exopolysaccharide synthesis family protein